VNDPSAVLVSLPGWAEGVVLERLSNGPTNGSYLVERDGERFVLRIDKPEARRLGLNRESERAVLEALAGAGLDRPPLLADPARGLLLRAFVPGRAWRFEELHEPGNLARLAGLLRRVHALPPAGRPFDPLGAAARYADQVGTARARERYEAAANAFAHIGPAAPALCHNDPVCGNVLETDGGPMLIDWEYAGIGDPFFDLAVVVRHHGVAAEAAQAFFAAYLGREPAAAETRRLERQCAFYACLLDLWRLRTGAGTNV